LNNSSKREFLGQAGLVLESMWQLILTSSGSNVPLIVKQQHATYFTSDNTSFHSYETRVSFATSIPDSPGSSNDFPQMKLISLSSVFFAI